MLNVKNKDYLINMSERYGYPTTDMKMKQVLNNELKGYTTQELVRELCSREGVDVTTLLPGWEYSVEKNPPEEDTNLYDYFDDEADNPGMWSSLSGEGPSKIIVVRGDE